MSSTTLRKRRTTSTSCSRRNSKRSRTQMSQVSVETIDVLESDRLSSHSLSVEPVEKCGRASTRRSGYLRPFPSLLSVSSVFVDEEVVDLTCEGSEPAVVDLTNNDSVVLVDDGSQSRRAQGPESYVLSSDDEEEPSQSLSPAFLSSLHASTKARSTPGAVSCPVCMDAYAEIIESGRLMVSTKCGHLFCSQCIRDSLARAHNCPTCRKKLTYKQYHPIYI